MIVQLADAKGLLPGDVVAHDDYGHLGVVATQPQVRGPHGAISVVVEKADGEHEPFMFKADAEIHAYRWRAHQPNADPPQAFEELEQPTLTVMERLVGDLTRLVAGVRQLTRRVETLEQDARVRQENGETHKQTTNSEHTTTTP